MQKLVIDGGRPLSGEIKVQGAKNAVLPVLAACTLCSSEVRLSNCPCISDRYGAARILTSLGGKVRADGTDMTVDCTGIDSSSISCELMRTMRSSIIFMGALMGRTGKCTLCYPGGCDLGPRPIDMHLSAMKKMGASLAFQETLPSHPMLNELKAFFKSFTYAFSGVMHAVRHERNMRFHLCAAVTVLAVSAICGITRAELLAVVICISSVISAELINTAVENAVDAASKNISPKAKAAKDCAAGAVLICALFSAVCGTVIFINRERLTVLWEFFAGNLTAVLLLAVWLILAFMFVFKPKNN